MELWVNLSSGDHEYGHNKNSSNGILLPLD